MSSFKYILAALVATAQASKDSRTHAVLRFTGNKPLMEGRVDPINFPGKTSAHVHTVLGGSNIGISSTGDTMMGSSCSNAMVLGDNSGYWVPKLYFRNPSGLLEPVELSYFNVYYFFEPTDDHIVSFPVGLQIHSGDAAARKCMNNGGLLQLDGGSNATIQPTQWTCPRSSYQPPSWLSAAQSDGSTCGIQDPHNQEAGQGFPDANCDGYGSPLRQDVHFPSCYDPTKSLSDHEHNMVFPTTTQGFKQNCPPGFVHTPHLMMETYWKTQAFAGRWTPFQGQQPFVLANGDISGCSAHGDFMAAWDTTVLQHIIDTCDVGEAGMHQCAGVTPKSYSDSCTVPSPIDEEIYENLVALPGNNPIQGWGKGAVPKVRERSFASQATVPTEVPEMLLGFAVVGTVCSILGNFAWI